MNRRSFLALSPAFPAAAVSASLVLREEGKRPVELNMSVLKLQTGDSLIIQSEGHLSAAEAESIKGLMEHHFPGNKAMVMSDGLKLAGVLRGASYEK